MKFSKYLLTTLAGLTLAISVVAQPDRGFDWKKLDEILAKPEEQKLTELVRFIEAGPVRPSTSDKKGFDMKKLDEILAKPEEQKLTELVRFIEAGPVRKPSTFDRNWYAATTLIGGGFATHCAISAISPFIKDRWTYSPQITPSLRNTVRAARFGIFGGLAYMFGSFAVNQAVKYTDAKRQSK